METPYEKQARTFLERTQSELVITFIKKGKHFEDDKQNRNIYNVILRRGTGGQTKAYVFQFGDSIQNTQADIQCKPTAYSIFACLTKYDPCSFVEFCGEYGYEEDSRKAESIFQKVKNEYDILADMYNEEEMALLAEIV